MQPPLATRSASPPTWVDAMILAAAAAGLLGLGWRKWTHFLVDFGRELYVPWQLAEGQTLYADIAYFNGPLSPYFNALVFRLAGPGLASLEAANLLVLLAVTLLLYRLLGRLGDRLSRLAGSLVFLAVFALADLSGYGNYNFVTPYSHEMTHGLLLSLSTVVLLARYLERRERLQLGLAGLLLGLVFLTKAEFFVATAGALVVAVTLESSGHQNRARRWLGRLGVALTVSLLPVAVAFLLLVGRTGLSTAARGVLGSWAHVFNAELTGMRFYRVNMGTLDPTGSLFRMAAWSGVYLAAFVPAVVAGRWMRSGSSSRMLGTAIASLWASIVVVMAGELLNPADLVRPLPLVLIAALLILARGGHRNRDALLVAASFALLLLLKIFLFPRLHHYGFALALPAMMVSVVLLLDVAPRWIDRRGGRGSVLRVAGLLFLILLTAHALRLTALGFARKTHLFGRGADRILVAEDSVVVSRALAWLEADMGDSETLAVLPEGAMLNFQLRRASSTPYTVVMPPEVAMFREEEILDAFRSRPPDVIVMVKRGTREYGSTTLGDGYGELLVAWIRSNYGLVESFHDPALEPRDFARVFILRKTVPERESAS